MLEQLGYTVFHTGLPDFLAIRDGVLEAFEVKRRGDRLRDHQEEVRVALRAVGVPYRLITSDGAALTVTTPTDAETQSRCIGCHGRFSPSDTHLRHVEHWLRRRTAALMGRLPGLLAAVAFDRDPRLVAGPRPSSVRGRIAYEQRALAGMLSWAFGTADEAATPSAR